MANLIRSYHPHHLDSIITFNDLKDWIDSFFVNGKILVKKWDGISTPLSLDFNKKKLGIKRAINKPPLDVDYINKNFVNKKEALKAFQYLLSIANKKKDIFNILKLNLNPSLVLLIEYIAPNLNIINYNTEKFIVIGLFNIKGTKITPIALEDTIYVDICNQLNNVSSVKFEYNNSIDIDLSMYKKSFYDLLKKKKKIKNIKLSGSLYDVLETDNKISKSYKNIYKKKVTTSSIKYYNSNHSNFSYGLVATEIIVCLGDFLKDLTDSQDIEGFVFYDYEKETYLKLVGSFIKRLSESRFSNNKVVSSYNFITG